MSTQAHVRRQIGLLAALQALLLTNSGTLISVNVLAGLALSGGNAAYATLPVTGYVLGSAVSTMLASLTMKRVGRRNGFLIGGLFCIVGSLLCAAAMYFHQLALLIAGAAVVGVFNAFGQYYRFAAADIAQRFEPGFKERAISLVLAGGIVGGIVGPETSMRTYDAMSVLYMGSYIALIGFALLSMLIVSRLDLPVPNEEERHGVQRPMKELARQPAFVVAILAAMISYGIMNLLMTAIPLAMKTCGYAFRDSAFVLEWHIIGMFAPGLITGNLIKRFGKLTIMMTGVLVLIGCALVAISGISIAHFWVASVMLGIGWNFIFVAATTLLTETYVPAEKAKVQGLNDSLVFAAMITSSFSSGVIYSSNGWDLINLFAIPVLGVLAGAIAWLGWHRRRAAFAT